MNPYQHNRTIMKRERLLYLAANALLLIAALLLAAALINCHGRTQPGRTSQSTPTVIFADTTRTQLVHRAEESGQAITIIHERNQQPVDTYEKSVIQYDSIRVALP